MTARVPLENAQPAADAALRVGSHRHPPLLHTSQTTTGTGSQHNPVGAASNSSCPRGIKLTVGEALSEMYTLVR